MVAKTDVQKSKAEEPDIFAAPEGFKDATSIDIDGWYKAEVGRVLQGKVVSAIQIQDDEGKMRKVALVQLTAPCDCMVKGNDKPIPFEVGKVIGFSITKDTAQVLQYVENQGECRLVPKEKIKLKGTRSMWKYAQAYKGKKGAIPVFEAVDSESDDIPF